MAGKIPSGVVSCSVCLEHVGDAGERSTAKLKCGHHFHLDCIGSAFNAKGVMQCPNCRHVEDGRWLYATGCRSQEDFSSLDDVALPYEDEYEVYASIAEFYPQLNFQWCPYQQFSVTLEEMEPAAAGFHTAVADGDVIFNLLDQAASAANGPHLCPYLHHHQQHHHHHHQQQQHQPRHTEHEQVVLVQNEMDQGLVAPGGNVSMNMSMRGFPVERTGWGSQHLPATPSAVGMMNDVGLSSLPIDRFRWSAPANRSSEHIQPRFTGQLENNPTSLHVPPCPQHAAVGSVNANSPPPRYLHNVNSARRSSGRHRGYAGNSSSSAAVAAAGSGFSSRLAAEISRPSRTRDQGYHQQELGYGWHQFEQGMGFDQAGGGEYPWRPWLAARAAMDQPSSASSYRPFGGVGDGGALFGPPDYFYAGQQSYSSSSSPGFGSGRPELRGYMHHHHYQQPR